jgi:hypothetical protein
MGMVIGATAAAAPVGGDGHRYPRPKRARGHHNTPQSEAVVHRSLETAAAFVVIACCNLRPPSETAGRCWRSSAAVSAPHQSRLVSATRKPTLGRLRDSRSRSAIGPPLPVRIRDSAPRASTFTLVLLKHSRWSSQSCHQLATPSPPGSQWFTRLAACSLSRLGSDPRVLRNLRPGAPVDDLGEAAPTVLRP